MTTLPPSLANQEAPAGTAGASVETGAGNETRTRDPDLGKVVLYQLSYSRISSKEGELYVGAVRSQGK